MCDSDFKFHQEFIFDNYKMSKVSTKKLFKITEPRKHEMLIATVQKRI